MAHVSISVNVKKHGMPVISTNESNYQHLNINIDTIDRFIAKLTDVSIMLKENKIDNLLKGIK